MRSLLSFLCAAMLAAACNPNATPSGGAHCLGGCAGSPNPTPSPIVPPPGTVEGACANLAKVGCSEGGPSCVSDIVKVDAADLTTLPLLCWQSSTSKAAVRACGQISCL